MREDVSDRRTWHLDKGVPIAVIITLVVLVVSIARDQSKQDERIALIEGSVEYVQRSRGQDRNRTEKRFHDFKTDLRSINKKLDRLIESEYGRSR
jgi:hypothetical protein